MSHQRSTNFQTLKAQLRQRRCWPIAWNSVSLNRENYDKFIDTHRNCPDATCVVRFERPEDYDINFKSGYRSRDRSVGSFSRTPDPQIQPPPSLSNTLSEEPTNAPAQHNSAEFRQDNREPPASYNHPPTGTESTDFGNTTNSPIFYTGRTFEETFQTTTDLITDTQTGNINDDNLTDVTRIVTRIQPYQTNQPAVSAADHFLQHLQGQQDQGNGEANNTTTQSTNNQPTHLSVLTQRVDNLNLAGNQTPPQFPSPPGETNNMRSSRGSNNLNRHAPQDNGWNQNNAGWGSRIDSLPATEGRPPRGTPPTRNTTSTTHRIEESQRPTESRSRTDADRTQPGPNGSVGHHTERNPGPTEPRQTTNDPQRDRFNSTDIRNRTTAENWDRLLEAQVNQANQTLAMTDAITRLSNSVINNRNDSTEEHRPNNNSAFFSVQHVNPTNENDIFNFTSSRANEAARSDKDMSLVKKYKAILKADLPIWSKDKYPSCLNYLMKSYHVIVSRLPGITAFETAAFIYLGFDPSLKDRITRQMSMQMELYVKKEREIDRKLLAGEPLVDGNGFDIRVGRLDFKILKLVVYPNLAQSIQSGVMDLTQDEWNTSAGIPLADHFMETVQLTQINNNTQLMQPTPRELSNSFKKLLGSLKTNDHLEVHKALANNSVLCRMQAMRANHAGYHLTLPEILHEIEDAALIAETQISNDKKTPATTTTTAVAEAEVNFISRNSGGNNTGRSPNQRPNNPPSNVTYHQMVPTQAANAMFHGYPGMMMPYADQNYLYNGQTQQSRPGNSFSHPWSNNQPYTRNATQGRNFNRQRNFNSFRGRQFMEYKPKLMASYLTHVVSCNLLDPRLVQKQEDAECYSADLELDFSEEPASENPALVATTGVECCTFDWRKTGFISVKMEIKRSTNQVPYVKCLIDSGSEISIIKPSALQHHGVTKFIEPATTAITCTGFNNSKSTMLNKVWLIARLGVVNTKFDFMVGPPEMNHDVILGMNVLDKIGIPKAMVQQLYKLKIPVELSVREENKVVNVACQTNSVTKPRSLPFSPSTREDPTTRTTNVPDHTDSTGNNVGFGGVGTPDTPGGRLTTPESADSVDANFLLKTIARMCSDQNKFLNKCEKFFTTFFENYNKVEINKCLIDSKFHPNKINSPQTQNTCSINFDPVMNEEIKFVSPKIDTSIAKDTNVSDHENKVLNNNCSDLSHSEITIKTDHKNKNPIDPDPCLVIKDKPEKCSLITDNEKSKELVEEPESVGTNGVMSGLGEIINDSQTKNSAKGKPKSKKPKPAVQDSQKVRNLFNHLTPSQRRLLVNLIDLETKNLWNYDCNIAEAKAALTEHDQAVKLEVEDDLRIDIAAADTVTIPANYYRLVKVVMPKASFDKNWSVSGYRRNNLSIPDRTIFAGSGEETAIFCSNHTDHPIKIHKGQKICRGHLLKDISVPDFERSDEIKGRKMLFSDAEVAEVLAVWESAIRKEMTVVETSPIARCNVVTRKGPVAVVESNAATHPKEATPQDAKSIENSRSEYRKKRDEEFLLLIKDLPKEIKNTFIRNKDRFDGDEDSWRLMKIRPLVLPRQPNHPKVIRCSYRKKFTDPEQAVIDDFIVTALSRKLITRSNSNMLSPLLIVPKPNGRGYRVCCDYRQVNSRVYDYNSHVVPEIQEIVTKVANKSMHTCLDIGSAYWRAELEDDGTNRETTAFVVQQGEFAGVYHWNVLPFGPKAAVSLFSRIIDDALRGLQHHGITWYIDDICCSSGTPDMTEDQVISEHAADLERLFSRARTTNLTFSIEKATIAKKYIELVGLVLGNGEVRASKTTLKKMEKAQDMVDLEKPLKSFLSILGLYNYSRRFIPQFSKGHKEIRSIKDDFDATKKVKNKSENELETLKTEGHLKIKKILVNWTQSVTDTSLSVPSTSEELEIATDASGDRAAWVCRVKDTGRIVEFGSREFSDCEKRYTIMEKELAALSEGLEKLKMFTFRAPRTHCYCDNMCAVSHLNSPSVETTPRALRFIQRIHSTPNCTYSYIKTNLNPADCLTRDLQISSITESKITPTAVDTGVQAGPGDVKETTRRKLETLHLDYGHPGQNRLTQLAKLMFPFMSIPKDVAKSVGDNCPTCVKQRRLGSASAVGKMPIPSGPNEIIHIDHFDPAGKDAMHRREAILSVRDSFSKFTCLYPCKGHSHSEILEHLRTHVMIFGPMVKLRLDNALNSKAMRNFAELFGFELVPVPAHSPQTNGVVERVHADIRKILPLTIDRLKLRGDNWVDALPRVTNIINSSPHSVTKVAPADIQLNFSTLDALRPKNAEKFKEIFERLKTAQDKCAKSQAGPFKETTLTAGQAIWAFGKEGALPVPAVVLRDHGKSVDIQKCDESLTRHREISLDKDHISIRL